VGIVRISDVVRCIAGGGDAWLKVVLLQAPEGAWLFNRFGRYREVLQPLHIAPTPTAPLRPGIDDLDDGDDTSDEEAEKKPPRRPKTPAGKKVPVQGKALPPPPPPDDDLERRGRHPRPPPKKVRPLMTWYDTGDVLEPQVWFRAEPYLPSGVVLKIRSRPADDAQVVGGLGYGMAARAVCSSGDWLMVAYSAPSPLPMGNAPPPDVNDPHHAKAEAKAADAAKDGEGGGGARAGDKTLVSKEGWMLLRTAQRVLLVAVSDPEDLQHLAAQDLSPAALPLRGRAAAAAGGGGSGGDAVFQVFGNNDSSSEEEQLKPAQQKELRRVQKEANKDKKKSKKPST